MTKHRAFRTSWPLAIVGLLTLLAAGPAAAQQLIAWPLGRPGLWRQLLPGQLPPPHLLPMPHPMPAPRPSPHPAPAPDGAPLELASYRVEGRVVDQAADLVYHLRFHNTGDQRLEGVFLMPIPGDAVLGSLTMTVGGKEMKGELLDAGQASAIYESIVHARRDPALLELVGERLVRARVFPIEPRSHVDVTLNLSSVLRQDAGLVSLNVPVRSARFERGGGEGASVRIDLRASRPLRSIYAGAPGVGIERDGERAARISYRPASGEPAADLSVFYSLRSDPLAAGLVAYRDGEEAGFFMLTLSPKLAAAAKAVVPKDIVFVVDRSGSMQEGGKMEQARRALLACLKRLSPQDRFGIVDFATDARSFADELSPASGPRLARAERYAQELSAGGGTNIEGALASALRLLRAEPGRLPMLFFLTDGLPTVGATNVDEILRRAASLNAGHKARVFAFGVGADVNTLLLDKLAESNGGARDYVATGEDIEAKLSGLYGKVALPALTDVRIAWEGLEAAEVYPRPVADIFHGSDLVLLGRYRGAGKGRLVVSGRAAGKPARFEFPVELPAADARHAFLPRLWASRKVAHELDVIRLSGGGGPEAIDGIVRLAKRYGIVTPYTSYLITDEGQDLERSRRAAARAVQGMARDAAASGFSGGAALAKKAQAASATLLAMRGNAAGAGSGFLPASVAAEARLEAAREGRALTELRSVGAKTFYRRGPAWVDAEVELLKDKAPEARIQYLSPEYFELLRRKPALSRALALGPEVAVYFEGTVYRVAP